MVQDGVWKAGYLGDVGLIITKIWCWYQFWKRAGRGLGFPNARPIISLPRQAHPPACLLCQLHRGQIGLKGTSHDKQPPSTSGGNADFRRCRVGDRHRHRHSSECQRAGRSVVGAFSPESRRLQFCRPSEFGRALPGRFRPVGQKRRLRSRADQTSPQSEPDCALVNGHSSGGPAPIHRRRRP
jgi:hypothetical protein